MICWFSVDPNTICVSLRSEEFPNLNLSCFRCVCVCV